jgi:hypothetical protein
MPAADFLASTHSVHPTERHHHLHLTVRAGLIGAVLALHGLAADAAEPVKASNAQPLAAQTRQASRLLSAPATDASSVSMLAAGALLEVLERKPGWVRVKTNAGEGWISAFDLQIRPVRPAGKADTAAALRSPQLGSSLMGVKGTDAGAGLDMSRPPDLEAYDKLRTPP